MSNKTEFYCVTDGDVYFNAQGGMYMKLNSETVHEYAYAEKEEAEKVLAVLKNKMYDGNSLKLATTSLPL